MGPRALDRSPEFWLHSGKSATIRESNHGSGVCKEHYAYYYVPKSSILLAGTGYSYSDILMKKHKLHLSHILCCNHTSYCVNMISVTSASRYQPRYQSRSSMSIRGLIPWSFAELVKAIRLFWLMRRGYL